MQDGLLFIRIIVLNFGWEHYSPGANGEGGGGGFSPLAGLGRLSLLVLPDRISALSMTAAAVLCWT